MRRPELQSFGDAMVKKNLELFDDPEHKQRQKVKAEHLKEIERIKDCARYDIRTIAVWIYAEALRGDDPFSEVLEDILDKWGMNEKRKNG